MSPKSFYIEKTAKKVEINLQIVKVSSKEAKTIDKKIHNVIISCIGKKRKREMEVVDFIIIRGEQSFEAEKTTDPIEIEIGNEQIQNIFDRYKKNKIRFRAEALLISR